jgi:hypothetical protein
MVVAAMTSHTGRLYALVGALFTFFVVWAVVAAHPWATTAAATRDPRLAALALREQRLRADAALVQRVVDRRFAAYKVALAQRRAQIAAAQSRAQAVSVSQVASPSSSPSVRVVTLPPLVITKTS